MKKYEAIHYAAVNPRIVSSTDLWQRRIMVNAPTEKFYYEYFMHRVTRHEYFMRRVTRQNLQSAGKGGEGGKRSDQ